MLISAVLTTLVVPWLKSRVSRERLARAMEWAGAAVRAAEQIYNGPGRGSEKLEYVLGLRERRGIGLDAEMCIRDRSGAVHKPMALKY